MFSYHVTKIDNPRVPISVVDLGIVIKDSLVTTTLAYPEDLRRSLHGCCVSEGEPTKEFSRMGYVAHIRRRTDEGVLLGWVMFAYFLLSRRLLLSRSMYPAYPKDRRRSPLEVVACLYRLGSACFCR